MTRPFLSLLALGIAALFSLRAVAAEPTPLVASLLNNDVMRLRVEHLTGNFAEEFLAAQPTNKLDGIILDLRSADGDKNADTAANGILAEKKFPLVILVNGQTRGTAATLAADLRTAGDGILVGSADFTGKTRPDIAVTVTGEDEKKFLADPFFVPLALNAGTLSVTNELLPFVDHMSEAELVRKRLKDGEGEDTASPRTEPTQPVIRDPALARAVDLLKALAVLHPARG